MPNLVGSGRRLVDRVRAALSPSSEEDRGILLLYLDMAFQGIVAAGATAYLSVFAVRLGASTFLIGLLSSLPSLLLVLSAVPAGRYVARQPGVKAVVIRSRIAFRVSYLFIALVPWLFPHWGGAAIVVIWALAAIPTNFVEVSVTAALAEAIPPKRRATVISTRYAVHACVAALALPVVGRLLDTLPFPLGYQVVFAGSFVAAMLSVWVFSKIRIPDQKVAVEQKRVPSARRLRGGLAALRVNRAFGAYLLALTLFRFGMALPQPLFSVFWVRDLGLSDGDIATATMVVYAFSIVGYFFWGRVANKYGHGPVLLAATLGLGIYPLVTAMARGLPLVLVASCSGGLFSSALALATFNVLLALAPPEKRADYVALNAVSVNVTSLVGPLLGPALAGWAGIRVAMLVAAGVRFLGGVLFLIWPVREGDAGPDPKDLEDL